MALSLGVAEDDINCSNTAYAFNAADYTDGFANESFVTKNGMRWRIVPAVASTADGTLAQYQADIYVDVNPENNNINDEDESCIYSSDSCEEPDIFKFMVSANGDVTPADPMGREYINTRKSLVRKKYELDSDVIAEMSPERSFSYIPCRALTEEEQCTADGGFWYDEACNACPVGQNLIDGVCQTPGGGGGGTPSGGKQKIDNYILVAGTTGEYITVRAMYPPASDLWINVPSYKRHGTYSHSCNLRDGLYQKITAGSYYGAYLSPSGIPGTSGNPARFKVDGKAVYFAGIHCGYWSDYSPNGITVSPASDDKYNYIICTETSGCPAGFKFDSPLATPPQ